MEVAAGPGHPRTAEEKRRREGEEPPRPRKGCSRRTARAKPPIDAEPKAAAAAAARNLPRSSPARTADASVPRAMTAGALNPPPPGLRRRPESRPEDSSRPEQHPGELRPAAPRPPARVPQPRRPLQNPRGAG